MKDTNQMIKYIFLTIISYTMLYANEPTKITVNVSCYDSRNVLRGEFFNTDSQKEKFTISFSRKKLDQFKMGVWNVLEMTI